MFCPSHNNKVPRSVVQAVAVFVVHTFMALELSSQDSLHHQPMLINGQASDAESFVTVIDRASTSRPVPEFSTSSLGITLESRVVHLTEIFSRRLLGAASHGAFVTVTLKGCRSGITMTTPAHVVGNAPAARLKLPVAPWDRAGFHPPMVTEKP